MIIKLGLAASDGPCAGGLAGAGRRGQLAASGGASRLLRIEDSKTGSGSDSESEPPADQDPPEQDRDSASHSEASQPADPGEYIVNTVKYCEILWNTKPILYNMWNTVKYCEICEILSANIGKCW